MNAVNLMWYLKLYIAAFLISSFIFAQLVTDDEAKRIKVSKGYLWFLRSIIYAA